MWVRVPRFDALRELQLIDAIDIFGKLGKLFIAQTDGTIQTRLKMIKHQAVKGVVLPVEQGLAPPPRGVVPDILPIEPLAPEGAFLFIVDAGGGFGG